jgi:serine/threonine-protein kinase
MSSGAYPCPLCGGLHDEARRLCPTTGKRIPDPPGGALDGAEQALVGKTVAGRYRVRGILGQGGMAAVFEADDLQASRVVALKILRQKHARNHVPAKRLMREAKLAGALGHPNICQVLDMGQLPDGTPYLATERLYGETLAQRLTRDRMLPFEEAVLVVLQVLGALEIAHGRSIVHRDITPGNIFLLAATGPGGAGMAELRSTGPFIKILDFGFSKLLLPSGEEGTETGLTGEGIVVGTPHYMSPEQIRGDKELDGRADLFALGAVFYRTLTGERPFSGPTMSAVLHAILTKTPPPPTQLRPELPAGIDLVVQTAMQRDKNKRFRSAGDFRNALSTFNVEVPTQKKPVPRQSFDLFEESGEHGPRLDSIEVEFSSSTEPQGAAARLPAPSMSLEPTIPRQPVPPPAKPPQPLPRAQRARESSGVEVEEDDIATVERNPAVDELLRMGEQAGADDARPTMRPQSSPDIPDGGAAPYSTRVISESDERTYKIPPPFPKPRPPPPPRKK